MFLENEEVISAFKREMHTKGRRDECHLLGMKLDRVHIRLLLRSFVQD